MNPFLFLLLIIAISCEDNDKVYKVSGTVYSIDINKQKAMIAHDTIPNLMMPMTMPFYIQNKKDLTKIKIGDSVHFELVWEEIKPFARNFTILGKGFIPQDDEFFSDEFSEKNIGSVLDDASFLNLDSIRVNLSHTDGEYRFISYVFSRCPMPNLCPAIVLKNAALVNQFPEINFIMISFDYKHDTPTVLNRSYGSSVNSYKNWDVWSSTGFIEDVYRLVRQSGGNFWGIEQEKIGHILSSVLIGKNREMLGVWKGENWEVSEVGNALKLLTK